MYLKEKIYYIYIWDDNNKKFKIILLKIIYNYLGQQKLVKLSDIITNDFYILKLNDWSYLNISIIAFWFLLKTVKILLSKI